MTIMTIIMGTRLFLFSSWITDLLLYFVIIFLHYVYCLIREAGYFQHCRIGYHVFCLWCHIMLRCFFCLMLMQHFTLWQYYVPLSFPFIAIHIIMHYLHPDLLYISCVHHHAAGCIVTRHVHTLTQSNKHMPYIL